MKQINMSITNDILYYEKLDNGLEVYMVPKSNKNNVYATFTTKFGGKDIFFKPINENESKKFPKGIAHFLEHKMFEQEDGTDAFNFFSKSGTSSNAFTSIDRTTYEFDGPKDLIPNTIFLLDFVQSPYLTDENVESEKGIITQEINMTLDQPDTALYYMTLENIINENPYNNSIIGTVDDITSITKEDLTLCYKTFYNPSNMFLVITGKLDPNELIEAIKENQSKKTFDKSYEIPRMELNEKDDVVNPFNDKKMAIEIPKVSYAIKIKKQDDIDNRYLKTYLNILFYILFGPTSKFNEKLKDEEILNYNIDYYLMDIETHFILMINGETNKQEEFTSKIESFLNEINIEEKDFKRVKKVFLSSYILSSDNIYGINNFISSSVVRYGKFYNDYNHMLEKLNLKELKNIIKNMDLSNKTINVIKPIEK